MPSSSSTNTMLNNMMEYLSFLLSLIEAQQWNKFAEVALSNPKTFKMVSKAITQCEELNGMTLLHACVRFDPPIAVLERMIKLYPHALTGEDCLGSSSFSS